MPSTAGTLGGLISWRAEPQDFSHTGSAKLTAAGPGFLFGRSTLSVAPGAAVRTWKQNVSHLAAPFEVQRGSRVEVLLYNDGDNQVQVAGGSAPPARLPPIDPAGRKL